MSRTLTPAEKLRYQSWFPNLDVSEAYRPGNAIVYGVRLTRHGCLIDRWLWPGSSLGDFDTFYRGFGFVRSGDGSIAAWGHSPSKMTHGSISGPSHGPRWESKCGADLRIQHGLNELAGSIYGHVVAFYRRSSALQPVFSAIERDSMSNKVSKSYLTSAQRKALREQRAQVSAELQNVFDEAFSAWKTTWFSGGLAISSDPHMRAVGKEFDTLIALGPPVLPLVIEVLSEPENFLALQLYDAMQSKEQLLVQFGPDDERILEGEQGRARRVVQAWFANQ